MSAPVWMKRLARPETRLVQDETGQWVVRAGKGQGRTLARLSLARFREARRQSWLHDCKTGGFDLSEEGQRAFERLAGQLPGKAKQPRTLIEETGEICPYAVTCASDPLSRWSGEGGWLSAGEHAAGTRLMEDWSRSSLNPRMTADWLRVPGGGRGGPEEASLSAIAAKDRVMRALEMAGPALSRLLTHVCFRQDPLGALEHSEGWPARSGKLALKLALQAVARSYGMPV